MRAPYHFQTVAVFFMPHRFCPDANTKSGNEKICVCLSPIEKKTYFFILKHGRGNEDAVIDAKAPVATATKTAFQQQNKFAPYSGPLSFIHLQKPNARKWTTEMGDDKWPWPRTYAMPRQYITRNTDAPFHHVFRRKTAYASPP